MSEVICSEKNPLIKRIRKLQQKKKRDASGQMIIEGSNLIREAVQKGICMDALLISDIYPSLDGGALYARRSSRTGGCVPF